MHCLNRQPRICVRRFSLRSLCACTCCALGSGLQTWRVWAGEWGLELQGGRSGRQVPTAPEGSDAYVKAVVTTEERFCFFYTIVCP